MTEQFIPSCDRLASGFTPDKKSGIVQFNLTEGCRDTCGFCPAGMERAHFRVKSPSEFESHIDQILDEMEHQSPEVIKGLNALWIGTVDALGVDTEILRVELDYVYRSMTDVFGTDTMPQKATIFGKTQDIAGKSFDELIALKRGGVCSNRGCSTSKRGIGMVVWPLDSGSSEVLEIAGKGYDFGVAVEAAKHLFWSDIRRTVVVTPGLGGVDYFYHHVVDTASLLNLARPERVAFRALPSTLLPHQLTEQVAMMIERLRFPTTISICGNQDAFERSLITLDSFQIENSSGASKTAELLRNRSMLIS